jgi:tetratricopeptide (TPR) repeat protein
MTWKIGKKLAKGKYIITDEIKGGNHFTANVGMGLISYSGTVTGTIPNQPNLKNGTKVLIQTFNDSVPLVTQERLCERVKLWQKVQQTDSVKWSGFTVPIVEIACEQEGGWFNSRKQWFWVIGLPPGQDFNCQNFLEPSLNEDDAPSLAASVWIQTAIDYIQHIGAGLRELHSLKSPLLHGFLAPDYIWLDAAKPDQPLLLPSYTAPINKSSLIHGFAAPEQYTGTCSPASDVYGLGALLYWLITDSEFPTPKSTDNLQEYNAITTGMAPSLWAVLAPALAYKPEERPSLTQWLEALAQVVLDVAEPVDLELSNSEHPDLENNNLDDPEPGVNDAVTNDAVSPEVIAEGISDQIPEVSLPDDIESASEKPETVDQGTDHDSLIEILNRAHALKAAGDNELALEAYQKVTAADPQNIEAWYEAGNVMARLKRYNEALTHYDIVLNLDPEYIKAWYNLGNVFKDLERYDEALIAYNRALTIEPNYHEAWNNRAIALRRQEKFDEAILSYQQAINLAPEHQAYRKNRDLLLKQLQQSHNQASDSAKEQSDNQGNSPSNGQLNGQSNGQANDPTLN